MFLHPKTTLSARWRKRVNAPALRKTSLPEVRQLVEAKTPATYSPASTSYPSVVSNKNVLSQTAKLICAGCFQTPLLLFLADLDKRWLVHELLLGRLGQLALTPRLCVSPLGRRTSLGRLTWGSVLPPSAILKPKGRGRRPVPSPKPSLLAPGRGQLLGAELVHRRCCWLRCQIHSSFQNESGRHAWKRS